MIIQCGRISYKLRQGEILDSWEKDFIYKVNCGVAAYNAGRPNQRPVKYVDRYNGYIADAYFLNWYLKSSTEYKDMPNTNCSKMCIRNLCRDWKAYYMELAAYRTKPKTMLGRPCKPGYYNKEKGRNWIVLTRYNIKEDGTVLFPPSIHGLHIKARHKNIKQIRMITKNDKIIVQLMYEAEDTKAKVDAKKVMGIDLGVDNLATVTGNMGMEPFILNGRPLKSVNQYYNKERTRLKEIARKTNGRQDTKRLSRLTEKRNDKVKDYLHKASCKIVEIAAAKGVGTIIIGNNRGWERENDNESFVAIPYQMLIGMITYKAKLRGIKVKVVEEFYTSSTSFLDGEEPVKQNCNHTRRIHRGLFISNQGVPINADVNGAYQIMKKENVHATIQYNEKVVRLKVA
jgi:putative transposase